MGLYDIPDRAALNMMARSAKRILVVSKTLTSMIAGTVYTDTLSISPIANSTKQFIGNYGDSSFTPDGSVFINEVSTVDLVLNNGDYFIDYLTGYYKVKAGASATPTVSWYVFVDFSQFPFLKPFISQTSVTVNHYLGYFPQVWVVNNNGRVLICDIIHNSNNDFTVEFAEAQTGTIYYR